MTLVERDLTKADNLEYISIYDIAKNSLAMVSLCSYRIQDDANTAEGTV